MLAASIKIPNKAKGRNNVEKPSLPTTTLFNKLHAFILT